MLFLLFFYCSSSLQGSVGTARLPPVIPPVPSINELAERGGYEATNYELMTEDGYSIWLHRIGKNCGTPVLMQHGIMMAADSLITRGHNKKDLAFMLLGLGYDVWLSNHRGTIFNEFSTKYNKSDPRFWNFSFHESGIYDLPSAIDKVLEVRKVKKIFYIGYSLGTITFAEMCALKPEYNDKIAAAMLMGPIMYLKPVNKFPLILQAFAAMKNVIIKTLTKTGHYSISLRNEGVGNFLNILCRELKFTQKLCLGIIGFFAGEHKKNMNAKDWSNFFLHVSGTSVKTLIHVLQLSMEDEFQQFDYGIIENLKRYNSTKPPKYNLKKLTTPVALFWSCNDHFTDEKSVKRIADALPNLLLNWPIKDKSYSHLDMVIGDNANIVLYPHIIEQIESINKTIIQGKR